MESGNPLTNHQYNLLFKFYGVAVLPLKPSIFGSLELIRSVARDPGRLPMPADDRFYPRRVIVVEPARMRPSWDTTERGVQRDFGGPSQTCRGTPGATLWLFQLDRPEVPWLADIWLQHGYQRPLSRVRTAVAEPLSGPFEWRYRDVRPGEAVRLVTVDTLVAETVAPALEIEFETPEGRSARLEIGATAWDAFPVILLQG